MRYRINFATYDRRKVAIRRNQKILLFCGILLLFVLFIKGMQKSIQLGNEINEIKAKKEELIAKKEKMLRERRNVFSDAEVQIIETKLKFYSDVFSNRLYTTAFLNVLEEKTPASIYLKTLDVDIERKNFIVTGESLNPESVATFIPSLQNINFVKKVEITKQSFQKMGEKKILISDFEIKGDLF